MRRAGGSLLAKTGHEYGPFARRFLHYTDPHCELGEPWRSGDALEVIAILDTPSWAALLRLIADFPVMHAVIAAPGSSRRRSVSAMAFEFISENRQIATIREFLASLPDALSG